MSKHSELIAAGLDPIEAWTHLHPDGDGHECPPGHCMDPQSRDEHLAIVEAARAAQLARGGIEAAREIEEAMRRNAAKAAITGPA